ncbi:MAG: hypothetical protein JWP87_943 [Labilithrix sp.]|nr:hypothetical protein [Labilithrix sp.]
MTSRPAFALLLSTLVGLGGSIGACSSVETTLAPQPVPPVIPPPPEDAGAPVEQPDAAPPKVAPKPTFPEVQSRGGPVIKTPKVVAIVFPGDPLATSITEFTSKISASTYWKDVGKEYGVGPMTARETIVLDEAPPAAITSAAIEDWLKGKLTGATPAFGAPDASTLYAIYYPASTKITMDGAGELGQSCEGYGGYHFEIDAGGTQVGYAVLPRCSDIGELTIAASHEYFEWATDPFPKTKPGFNKLDDAHWAWQATMIGELGDLCTFLDRDNLHPADIGFDVQRQWSNKASLAGKYPCAPAKDAPYLQAITTADDDAIVPSYDQSGKPTNINTKAVRVAPGKSRKVDVLVYSDQPHADLVPMRAMSYEEFYAGRGGGQPSGYTFTLDRSYAKVGDTISVTIDAPDDPAYDLMIMLAYTSKTSAHYWPVLVVNDDAADVGSGKATITPETMPKRPARDGKWRARAAGHDVRPFTTLGQGRARR